MNSWRRHPVLNLVVLTVVVLACLGGFLFTSGPGMVAYATGESVSAHVEDCQTTVTRSRRGRRSTNTTCTGSWKTAAGVKHTDQEIVGADTADEGQTVAVKVDGDVAVVDRPSRLWLYAVPVLALLVLLGLVLAIVAASGRRRRAREEAARRYAYPPNYPNYPPPPAGYRPGAPGQHYPPPRR